MNSFENLYNIPNVLFKILTIYRNLLERFRNSLAGIQKAFDEILLTKMLCRGLFAMEISSEKKMLHV